jgi:hypothetical protein
MVRLYLEPPQGNAEQAVDNCVQNHPEWTGDPIAHTFQEVTPPDGPTYVVGNYRFEQSVTAIDLLDDLEQRLGNFQGGLWFRVGYHVCDHDGDDREESDCEFDPAMTRESGAVPAGVPTFG